MLPKSKRFADWSSRWKMLRKKPVEFKQVLEMWQEPVPEECFRKSWQNIFGYRHNHKRGEGRGEQKVETIFLGQKGESSQKHHLIKDSEPNRVVIEGAAHKVALATQRAGQVIADCLGILLWRAQRHPLAVEIKIGANDVWFAVVENLQQVKMLRSNVSNLERYFKVRDLPNIHGAWGMVLAPCLYFHKKPDVLKKSLGLIDYLAGKTEARIMLAASDNIAERQLIHLGGHWPK